MLKNKVAVITGSGNGLGRAEAIGMAAQGAKVVVNDLGTSHDGVGASSEPADLVVEIIKQADPYTILKHPMLRCPFSDNPLPRFV